MTSILIADYHPMIRWAISRLAGRNAFDTIAQAADTKEALSAIAAHDPDIVILDLAMPGGSGMEVLRETRSKGDHRSIVILTAEIDDQRLSTALALGVDGIVLKNSDPAHLIACLSRVRDGGRWIDPALEQRAEAAAESGSSGKLSPREAEVAALVAKGLRNREIAVELGITEGTVKVFLHSIFDKLGVSNRTELALRSKD
jgi:two-component system nitrate/nitrite response regulator NarL